MTGPHSAHSAEQPDLRSSLSGEAVALALRACREHVASLVASAPLSPDALASALDRLLELARSLLGCREASLCGAGDWAVRGSLRPPQSEPQSEPQGEPQSEPQGELAGALAAGAGAQRAAQHEQLLELPVYTHGVRVATLRLVAAEGHAFQPLAELASATLAELAGALLGETEEGPLEPAQGGLPRGRRASRENEALQREVDSLHVATAAIRKSEDDLRRLFAASPVPLLLVRRADLRVLSGNDVAASVLRAQAEQLSERPLHEFFAHLSDLSDLLGALERGLGDAPREVQLRSAQGETFWALLAGRRVVFSGIDTLMLGFTDLTAQKAVEHQLRFLAQRDPLTQAYNRHHFWQLAHAEMARVKRYKRPLSVAMIDADHFKRVNDDYGHAVGDLVLRQLVETCHDSLRKNDVLARYGGEEFIVLLPETPLEGALAVVERLRDRIAQTPLLLDDGRSLPITASIGLAALGGAPETLEELLKRADEALYEAKRAGRNRVHVG